MWRLPPDPLPRGWWWRVVRSLGLLVGLFWCEATGRRFWQVPWRSRETPEVTTRLRRRGCVQARHPLFTLDGPITDDVRDITADAAPAPQSRRCNGSTRTSPRLKLALSLPGCEGLAVGRLTDCTDSDCERVQDETTADFPRARCSGTRIRPPCLVRGRASHSRSARTGRDRRRPRATRSRPPRRNARLDVRSRARLRLLARAPPRFLQLSLLDADSGRTAATGTLLRGVDALRRDARRVPRRGRAVAARRARAHHRARHVGPWPAARSTGEHQPWDYGGGPIFFVALPERAWRATRKRELVDQRDVRWTIERLFGVVHRGANFWAPATPSGARAPACRATTESSANPTGAPLTQQLSSRGGEGITTSA